MRMDAFVESVARELEEFAKTLTVHAPLLQQKCDNFLSISSAVLGAHCSFIRTPDPTQREEGME